MFLVPEGEKLAFDQAQNQYGVGIFNLYLGCGSSNGSDFHLEIRAFPVVGFLVIELGLQADEEVAGEAEAELGTEGEVGADCLWNAPQKLVHEL